jgi:hypothetical protein
MAKKIQSLARNANPQLISTFEASFDGDSLSEETFDEEFFVENAVGLVEDLDKADKDKADK